MFLFLSTFKKYEGCLKDLRRLDVTKPGYRLRELLFPDTERTPDPVIRLKRDIEWINETLNEPQRDAIKFGLESKALHFNRC